MSSPYLLIGNELPLYREVLKGVLQTLRPEIAVCTVPATEVDAVVKSNHPWLVICSAPSTIIEECAPAWILLHPNEDAHTIVSTGSERCTIPHPTIAELLGIIDAVWAKMPLTTCTDV